MPYPREIAPVDDAYRAAIRRAYAPGEQVLRELIKLLEYPAQAPTRPQD